MFHMSNAYLYRLGAIHKRHGGPTPFFPMGKLCLFPFFPMGKNGEKSIWKEREMNTFPSFSIYFFPIFPHGEKWGKDTFFPWAKMGLDPPRRPQNFANF